MNDDNRRRIEELFDRAAELAPAERAAFLDHACIGDEHLRSEVESLLATDATHDQVLKPFPARQDDGAEGVGTHIGPYLITGLIGKGGMGAVYRAERDDEFRMQVAVKLLKRGTDTEAALVRFRTERKILAGLQHPNIARLLDGGATQSGLPYFVMEYVDGKPLLEHAGQFSIRQRLELFRSVCAAVQYAHQNLVVHRDLKPGNILVTADGVVKLLDFGIAKLLDPAEEGATALTAPGVRPMTLAYASPEQIRCEPVTTATDVYSLGAVLYELLTGKWPHNNESSWPGEIERAICLEDPNTPSTIAANLDRDLDNIVLMALRKERERRYPSVEALSEDVRRYLEGLPVSARQDTVLYRAGKYVRRNRLAVVATAIVVASLILGFGVAVFQARRAERRFQQVRKLANTFLFSIHDKIQNLPGSTEARQFVVQTALEYLDSLAKEAGNDVQLQQELATAYLRVGEVQGDLRGPNLGHIKLALESYDKAIGLAAQVNRSDPTSRQGLRLLASGHMHRGDMLVNTGSAKEGIAALEKAADFAERTLHSGSPEADDYRTSVQVATRLGDAIIDDQPERALEIYEHGRELAEQLHARENTGRSKLGLVQVFQRIGRVSHALGNPVAGARNYREAQRIVEELAQSEPNNARYRRDLMVIYNFLGNLSGNPRYFHLDDPKTALEYYKKAAALQEQIAAADPKNAQAVTDRALGAAKMSDVLLSIDTPESVRQGRLCSEHIRPLLEAAPDNHRYLRIQENCLQSLGRALHVAGAYRESVETFDKALQISMSVIKRTPEDLGSRESVSIGHAELGDSYLAAGDVAAAEKHLAVAFEMVRTLRKENPKDLYFLRDEADIEQSLGDLAAKRGDRNLAARHYGNSLALWSDWRKLAPESPYVASKVRSVQELLERSKAHAGLR